MAGRGSGMKSSLSADDVGRPSRKPGKISADLLAQFESDPALSGSSSSLQFQRASPGHGSGSDMGSASASHEHLAPPAKRPNVRISEPVSFGSNEDMAVGIDHSTEYDERNEKKKKSIWKWGPLKKVRKFFSRKKSSRRAKSCEDLPASSTGLRPVTGQERLTVDEDLRHRTHSTPLHHAAEVHPKSSPVMRSRSMPPKSPNKTLLEAKRRQASSHEEIREERSPQPVSKTFSLPSLHNKGIRSLRDVYTEEGAVSFENDPSTSSFEGLQAAHDKIKAAPKKRRPPTRSRSRTSSLGVADTPVKPVDHKVLHTRSKTDPRELVKERRDTNLRDSSSLSDIMNNTIFETSEAGEEDGPTITSPQATQKDKEDVVMDDIMTRVNDILSQATGPSRLSGSGSPTTKLRAAKVEIKKTEEKELSTTEKRRSFPDKKTTSGKEVNFGRTTKETFEKKEITAQEKRRSFPDKKTAEKEDVNFGRTTFEKKELSAIEKRRSFPDNKTAEKEEVNFGRTTKETFEKKEITAQEKRRSFPDKKIVQDDGDFGWKTTQKSEKKEYMTQEKTISFPEKKSGTGFADSIKSSKAESEIVMAETTCQLESEVSFEDFEFDKFLDDEPTTSKQSPKEVKRDSTVISEREQPEKPQSSKPSVPLKRGKSWSNNYNPKLQEFPFNINDTETEVAKNEVQTNVLTEKREVVFRREQEKDENKQEKPKTSAETRAFRFNRTKSWSYGTKPVDVGKANAKENAKENEEPSTKSTIDKNTEQEGGPSWVAKANRMSRRISQLFNEDETSENQTPTLTKPNKNNINKPPASKPQTPPKPSEKPPLVIEKDPFKVPIIPSKPPVAVKDPVKLSTQEKPCTQTKPPKPLVIKKDKANITLQQKPNMHGRNAATLPARADKSNTELSRKGALDMANRQSLNLSSKENTDKSTVPDLNRKTFGSVKIEKCIICGTTVYQMEKCKFDDSVLHRNCIKCTVCKRHLTMGNFVMAESKIYCKPHSLTVTVST